MEFATKAFINFFKGLRVLSTEYEKRFTLTVMFLLSMCDSRLLNETEKD